MRRAPENRPLTHGERANLDRLAEYFLDLAFLTPTATGLRKGIIDAIEPVREMLLRAGLHDYNAQPKGQAHKRRLEGVRLARTGPDPIAVTLYRPETKDGDPRIWFYGLPRYASAGDMLAIGVLGGRIHVANLSGDEIAGGSPSDGYLAQLASRQPPGPIAPPVPDTPPPAVAAPVERGPRQESKEIPTVGVTLPETVTVEPTPRILQILGHVNFQGWQCIAELVDNSIDAFLRDSEAGRAHGQKLVRVDLPSQTDLAAGRGAVTVEDSASGMSLVQIRNACRAGFSGNDPVGKLGLFGMGFNVATVRLGRVTELLSHREGDDRWVGLRIDIDEMVRHGSFEAPVITEPVRDDEGPSGTRVRVSRIVRDGVVKSLVVGRGRASLTKKLARLYHVAAERYGVDIEINGARLPDWKLCLWGEDRSVPSQAWGRIPAQFPVDVELSPLPYCPNCWEWGVEDQSACTICGGDLMIRERRIRGVLGIQRSFAVAWSEGDRDSYYGVDLIRNGRVIEAFDKDLFYWTDPNDPGRRDLDYPVDAPYLGGRIIGQLEIDFVPLRSYHKDSFEKADRAWLEVREAVRGEGPLRPDIARKHGYERPDTPLARLFDGYRKTSPAGERYLITAQPPGTKANHKDPMHRGPMLDEWIAGFEAGDEEFQDDHHWWEAVQWAEAGDGTQPEEPTTVSPFDEPEAGGQVSGGGQKPTTTSAPADEPQLVRDEMLSVLINTEGIVDNAPPSIQVDAFRVIAGDLPHGAAVRVNPKPQGVEFAWDPKHQVFRYDLSSPFDALASEVAFQVIYRAQVTQREAPLSQVEREVASRAFPERTQSVDNAAQRATDLLQSIRERLAELLPESAPLDLDLQPADRTALERSAAARGVAKAALDEMVRSGSFIAMMPLRFLPKCALLFPGQLMGERGVFAFDYAGYDTEDLRQELRESLYSNLLDISWLVDERPNLSGFLTDLAKLQLRKSLAALELLELKRIA